MGDLGGALLVTSFTGGLDGANSPERVQQVPLLLCGTLPSLGLLNARLRRTRLTLRMVRSAAARSAHEGAYELGGGGTNHRGPLPNDPGTGYGQRQPTEGDCHCDHSEDPAGPVDMNACECEIDARCDE